MAWFDDVDLTPWCDDFPATATDMEFAQAIARKRATVRGVRQRITPGQRVSLPMGCVLVLRVEDQVAEQTCNGICVMASELIECAPNVVAHAHPDCEAHGETEVADPCS